MTAAELNYQNQIDELDRKLNEDVASQPAPTGTSDEIFNAIAKRIMLSRKYQEERRKLVDQLIKVSETSSSVMEYLKPIPIQGKEI